MHEKPKLKFKKKLVIFCKCFRASFDIENKLVTHDKLELNSIFFWGLLFLVASIENSLVAHYNLELKFRSCFWFFGLFFFFFFLFSTGSKLLSMLKIAKWSSHLFFIFLGNFICKSSKLSSNWIVVSNLFPFHLKILEPCYMNCFKVLNFVLKDTMREVFMMAPTSEEVEISG